MISERNVSACNLQQNLHFSHVQKGAVIGKNCSLGQNVNIGNNVKIGANSVVTKDIPNNSIAVGVPAQVIKVDYGTSSSL